MLPGKTVSGWTKTQTEMRYPRPRYAEGQQSLMVRATGGSCSIPSDTGVMPLKIQPHIYITRQSRDSD